MQPDTTTAHPAAPSALSPQCEQELRRLIRERTGIVLMEHQRENLRLVVQKACAAFGHTDCEQYLRALREQVSPTAGMEPLIAGITVGESYFFRDTEQLDLLRDELLPELVARKREAGERSLRVWSAGCSNGQEIYSIAMLLEELLPDHAAWVLHLLGTDINTEVLANAVRGRFSEWSFRTTPAAMKARYFTPTEAGGHELAARIRARAKFAYLNLTADAFPSILTETSALDLILCRNVFIYLEPEAAAGVMRRFAECLVPGGLLLLGPSDFVSWPTESLERTQLGNAGYFRRLDAAGALPQSSLRAGETARGGAAKRTDGKVKQARTAAARADPRRLQAPKIKAPRASADAAATDERLIELLRAERWRDALIAVEQAQREFGASAARWQIKGKALANLGQLPEALAACELSLALDPTEKHTWLVKGGVLMELDQLKPAEEALRRTLYLDYEFLEAHYELGLLLLRAGRSEAGLKSLRNALRLAERGDPERQVHNAQGMNYRRLAEVLRGEIAMYAGAPIS